VGRIFPPLPAPLHDAADRVRLAVSWWRAVKSEEWHRANRAGTVVGDGAPTARRAGADLLDQYDYDALDHLLAEVSLREAMMQEQFDEWNVVPHTIVYEDFIAAYEETVRGVLGFLQLPGAATVPVPAPSFDRLADAVSESWYRRFRREREER
jgi:trehalose 2-sulfotransferase